MIKSEEDPMDDEGDELESCDDCASELEPVILLHDEAHTDESYVARCHVCFSICGYIKKTELESARIYEQDES